MSYVDKINYESVFRLPVLNRKIYATTSVIPVNMNFIF